MTQSMADPWARWLLHDRHGGDPERLRSTLERLYPVRDRTLDNARVTEGDVVLDVGAGSGLIAFGALQRIGANGRVIFLDQSRELLDHCRALAEEMGVADRCGFVRASAEDLSPIADASVDVVTTRAVVQYVPDKGRAFREFFRVLGPGGRVSMRESINGFGFPEPPHLFWGYDVTPVWEIAERVRKLVEPPGYGPLLDFDERDLLEHAERAGFGEVHLELRADIAPREPEEWEEFLRAPQPPPGMSPGEAIGRELTAEEAERFTAHLRPLVEAGRGTRRWAAAYLWTAKL